MTAKVQVILVRTAGTNCDRELQHAFTLAGAEARLVHIGDLAAGRVTLGECQILAFPGGFSYGDDIAAGRVHANEIRAYLKPSLTEFVKQGKLVFGVCNGFQILVNARLLPGDDLMGDSQDITLAANAQNRFVCRWIRLRGGSRACVWFPEDRVIELPIAHGEGRLMARTGDILQRLRERDQIAFQYVDAAGKPGDYPVNPNGSTLGIAGLCDPTGRILGLMPHPERYVRPQAHPAWTRHPDKTEGDGLAILRNGVRFIETQY